MGKYLNLIGLAYRARKVSLGEDSILQDIRSRKATLVLIANDASGNTRKRLTDKCNSYDIPYRIVGSRQELSHALGKEDRVAVSVKDEGFAKKLMQLIND
ncbi:YlxQ family RNA-binding protein [Tenuibacillus multivorans]|uniref:Ribosomal protein L7Ae n=1 Tax=Tenuibacillus multivorans TaxID=237069 RepID=A0A1G9XVP5_9BACI|nr:YlxQ family RNA-binding protein [Tenuibacillus multivorans]GEL75836.1 50S ribosomal protein L7ae [Tenuibacillus multivorans]SDN00864.1 Ribosomal protein L7Ae [Tenuibacillus multivorans]